MIENNKKIPVPVEVYALGGLGEVGKNLYCVENDSTLMMIDCGVMFPDQSMTGIDYVIPDFYHLVENQKKIKALVITHGHEDHIGGIPFLLQRINLPIIYAPKIACALIRHKIQDAKLPGNITKVIEYNEDSVLNIGDFSLEFFKVTHSIPDSFGIYITTPQGTILETGDFKIDLTPVDGDFNLSKLTRFGDRGIDLLMADSTNAEKEGYTNSERTVIKGITDVFSEASGRLIISTFSSNISRIDQIIETAVKFKRKIIVFGRSMEANIDAAREYGYIKVSDENFGTPDELKSLLPSQVCVLCTGTQGEPMAVLSRIARGEHKFLHIQMGDTIVFSSSAIPGNTAAINDLINSLSRLGASVVTNSIIANLHASGHASKQEMRLMQKLARPHYFMPVHGEYRMLKLHARIGVECGLPKDHTFVCENGDVLSLLNHKVTRSSTPIKADSIYIDGKNPVGLSSSLINDRNNLVNEGMVAIFAVIDMRHGLLVSTPTLESKGFVSSNKKGLFNKLGEIVGIEIAKVLANNRKMASEDIKNVMKRTVISYLKRDSRKNPVVIPLIMNYQGDFR